MGQSNKDHLPQTMCSLCRQRAHRQALVCSDQQHNDILVSSQQHSLVAHLTQISEGKRG